MYFQLTVHAKDVTSSPLTGTATVTISVQRNLHGPVFDKSLYNITISEYHQVNSVVQRIQATDNDDPSSSSGILRYQINSSSPASPDPYFIVSSTSGEIYLSQILHKEGVGNQYRVSIHR